MKLTFEQIEKMFKKREIKQSKAVKLLEEDCNFTYFEANYATDAWKK